MQLVRAAGGLVWRQAPEGPRLAIIHRPSRDDWSLPKGRLDSGEPWRGAALREVVEETGCAARLSRFAGAKLFLERATPKLVLYWHMQAVREGTPADPDEVDEVAWLSPREALARLDHGSDRRLLLRALGGGSWRGGGRPPAAGAATAGPAALRRLLVMDREPSAEVLAPFLRLIGDAMAVRAHQVALA